MALQRFSRNTPGLWSDVQAELKKGENPDYRPTVMVGCLRFPTENGGTVEVVNIIPKNGQYLGLPQGGIEASDTSIAGAAKRELDEEVGLDVSDFLYADDLGTYYRYQNGGRRGSKIGSMYVPTLAIVSDTAPVSPQTDEVKIAEWRSLAETTEDFIAQHIVNPSGRTERSLLTLGNAALDALEIVKHRQGTTYNQVLELRWSADVSLANARG